MKIELWELRQYRYSNDKLRKARLSLEREGNHLELNRCDNITSFK